jgi:hypothetical protein
MCLGIPGQLVEVISEDFRVGTVEVSGSGVPSAWLCFPMTSASGTGFSCTSASPSRESTRRKPGGPWRGLREWARPTPKSCSHSRPAESAARISELPSDDRFRFIEFPDGARVTWPTRAPGAARSER